MFYFDDRTESRVWAGKCCAPRRSGCAAAASGSVQPGGRCFYLPGLLFGFSATREFEKCSGLPGAGPWISSAVTPRPGLCSQGCEPGGPVELRSKVSPGWSCCFESEERELVPKRCLLSALRRGAEWRQLRNKVKRNVSSGIFDITFVVCAKSIGLFCV